MNKLKLWFYRIAISDKNPVFRHFTKKEALAESYGRKYEILYKGNAFDVQIEDGDNGIIFDIHGGGYLFGDYMDENHFCHYLHEKTGMTIVSCNYDLSSKSQFPTQIEQVYETIKTICADPAINTEKIYVMGHSAGGNATAGVTLMSIDRGDFKVDGQILNYPVLDLYSDPNNRPQVDGNILPSGMMELFNELYFEKKEDAKNIYASPLFTEDDKLEKLPPTYIMTCSHDQLRVDGLKYIDRLKQVGVDIEAIEVDQVHGFLETDMYNFYGKSRDEAKAGAEMSDRICQWIMDRNVGEKRFE